MFGDQHDNVARMKAKGAAVEVDLQRMTSADLLGALKAVINNPLCVEHLVSCRIISFINFLFDNFYIITSTYLVAN